MQTSWRERERDISDKEVPADIGKPANLFILFANKLLKAKSCWEMARAHQAQHSASLQGADAGEEHQEPEHEAQEAPEEGDVHQRLPAPVG